MVLKTKCKPFAMYFTHRYFGIKRHSIEKRTHFVRMLIVPNVLNLSGSGHCPAIQEIDTIIFSTEICLLTPFAQVIQKAWHVYQFVNRRLSSLRWSAFTNDNLLMVMVQLEKKIIKSFIQWRKSLEHKYMNLKLEFCLNKKHIWELKSLQYASVYWSSC